jgi:hypothetical protein
MKRAIVSAFLVLIVMSVAYAAATIDSRFNVVQVDPRNHRLFVAPSGDILASHEALRTFITDLTSEIGRHYPEWGSRWSVSLFSDPSLATYKDDDRVRVAIQDGTWTRAYLAEFDHETHTMTSAPMNPDTVRWHVEE